MRLRGDRNIGWSDFSGDLGVLLLLAAIPALIVGAIGVGAVQAARRFTPDWIEEASMYWILPAICALWLIRQLWREMWEKDVPPRPFFIVIADDMVGNPHLWNCDIHAVSRTDPKVNIRYSSNQSAYVMTCGDETHSLYPQEVRLITASLKAWHKWNFREAEIRAMNRVANLIQDRTQ